MKPIHRYRPTRRELLRDATYSAVGLWALSVCAPTAPAPAKKGGEFHGAWPYDAPPTGSFNAYASKNLNLGIYYDLMQAPLGMWLWAEGKWRFLLAESLRLDGNTYAVKLRTGVKWSDGKPVTSKDVAVSMDLRRLLQGPAWRYLDKVDTPDETTVRYVMANPSNIAERFIMKESIRPAHVYGEFADRAKTLFAAGKKPTDKEWADLRKELTEAKIAEPTASGPYRLDPSSITGAQATLLRNAGGYAADVVAFDKIVLYNGETDQVTPLVLAGDVDYATHGFPVATVKQFEAQGTRIVRGPFYTGPSLVPHWEKAKAFQDVRVRQAVAYALNREENATVAFGESAKAPKFMAGYSDYLVPLWLSEADRNKLNPYKFDQKKAEDLLKEAGYSRGGDGIWAKGGEKLEFELLFPSTFADWSPAATNAAEQLSKFGVKITPRGVPDPQWSKDRDEGNFVLTMASWGTGPHPNVAFVQGLRSFNTTTAKGGMKYPLKQRTKLFGEVDLDKMIDETGIGLDAEKQKPAVTKLIQAFNELLPVVPLWERHGTSPVNEKARVTGWPAAGDKILTQGSGDQWPIILIFDGKLQGK